jgi:hypothetical protein
MARAPSIEEIMNEEIKAAQARITARCAPLLKAEFDRASKRHPKLKGVLFGNGTHYVDMDGYNRVNGTLPKALEKLDAMCSIASGTSFFVTAYETDLTRSES